jgi:hypothetical protein
LIIRFGLMQVQRASWLSKRVPFAAVVSFTGAWLLVPGSGPLPSRAAMMVLAVLAGTALLMPVIAFVEHRMRRLAGQRYASFLMVLQGRFSQAAVGLAILRGAFIGALLATLQVAFLHQTFARLNGSDRPMSILLTFGGLPNARPLWEAVVSGAPALFLLASMVFYGSAVALFCCIAWTDGYKSLQRIQKLRGQGVRGWYARSIRYTAWCWFCCILISVMNAAINSHLSAILAIGIPQFLVPFTLAALLFAVFIAFDMLTVAMAVASSILLTVGLPLANVLSEVGSNIGLIWALWAALIAGAVVCAFRQQLQDTFARFREA